MAGRSKIKIALILSTPFLVFSAGLFSCTDPSPICVGSKAFVQLSIINCARSPICFSFHIEIRETSVVLDRFAQRVVTLQRALTGTFGIPEACGYQDSV